MPKRCVLVLLVAAGCGASGGDGADDTSGVDEAKLVAALSRPELAALCTWVQEKEFTEVSAVADCTVRAVFGTATEADCEADRDSCVPQKQQDKEERHANIMGRCDPSDLDVIGDGCKSTVAEYERCVRDTFAQTRNYFSTFTCKRPMLGAQGKVIAPASCRAVDYDCRP